MTDTETLDAIDLEVNSEDHLGTKLKEITSGCKLAIRQVMCSRKMTDEQRIRMAEAFQADAGSVKGSREFLSRKLGFVKPLFKAATKARRLWKESTVAFDDGVRLIRTDKIKWMNAEISILQMEAIDAAQDVFDRWEEVVADARTRLVDLFVEEDYNFDIRDAFGITLSYPAIEPDTRLKTIAPELFEAEHKRIVAQFEEAAIVAENALQQEFANMVAGMLEKLEGNREDGKNHVIKQAGIDSLVDFAKRFSDMSIGNNQELSALVEKAKEIAGDVTVKTLKTDGVKIEFKTQLEEVGKALESFIASPIRKFSLEE